MDPVLQDSIHSILAILLGGLASVLTILIGLATRSLTRWAEAKAHSAGFACGIDKLRAVSELAVAEIAPLVERQKASGDWQRFPQEAAAHALAQAVDLAIRHLGPANLAEAMRCLGQDEAGIRDLIKGQVEREVAWSRGIR